MCDYCEKHKKIILQRAENINVHDCYIVKADDGTAMIFENVQGMPAYIDVDYCFHCGEPLTEPKPLSLDELRERDGKPVWVEEYKEWVVVEVDAIGCFKDIPFALGKNYNHDIKARGLTCYDRQPRREENVC